MLDILAFYAVLYVCIYTVVAQWQRNQSPRDGVLALVLLVFAFIILWALLSPLARLLYRPVQGVVVGPDTLGVVLTSAAHMTFVRMFFFSHRQRVSSQPQDLR
jgi:hypothetical protein